MKFTIAAVASMATIAMAAPTDIKYDVDWTKITYPEGTGKDAVPKGLQQRPQRVNARY